MSNKEEKSNYLVAWDYILQFRDKDGNVYIKKDIIEVINNMLKMGVFEKPLLCSFLTRVLLILIKWKTIRIDRL